MSGSATYTYDNDDHLTNQTMSLAGSGLQYGDSYTYDLDNNRMTDVHTTTLSLGGPAGTTNYVYNADDENTSSTLTVDGTNTITTNSYDANGSLTNSSTTGVSTPTTYTYDTRNKMVGFSGPSESATYVYDDHGNRVQETIGGATTYYLTDTQNPTGYAQPIEQWNSSSGDRSTATLQMTYVSGNAVQAQVTGSGTISYFLVDGHGSTRAMVGSSGTITSNSGTIFNYHAFGGAIGSWSLASAGTMFLFGGDAVYDSVSGLYMNGDGTRDRLGAEFIQMDSASGSTQDPISLHKYLYADADPINGNDPTGDYDDSSDESSGSDSDSILDPLLNEISDYESAVLSYEGLDETGASGSAANALLQTISIEQEAVSGNPAQPLCCCSGGGPAYALPAPAKPGPWQFNGTTIYFLNIPNGGDNLGHAAMIIPLKKGCVYLSYGDGPNNQVTNIVFHNTRDALIAACHAIPKPYTQEEHWNNINAASAAAALAAARGFNGTPYDTRDNNCWSMVFKGLTAAGANVGWFGPDPNLDYAGNSVNASGSSSAPWQ
jgi:hypothetical protein